jgi:N-acetylglucosamine kinase-like BadF-type ATPase
MKSKRKFYAGADSGGTKCEVLLASEEFGIISSRSYKGIHYSLTGAKEYSNAIAGFISDSAKKAGLNMSSCLGICVGAAGARENKDRQEIRKNLSKLTGASVTATTDAMTALAGSFDGSDGIILISGTGSVLYGLSENRVIRVGGWGRIFGDEGSGYWIGKRALNIVAREFDEKKMKGKPSMLSAGLQKEFGMDSSNINSMIFSEKLAIQSIAPYVINCAKEGCSVSRRIVDEAVEGLMWHINTFMKISRRKSLIEIAFTGSIIENDNILSRKLKKKISGLRIVKVVKRRHSPSFGAVLIAAGKFKPAEIV